MLTLGMLLATAFFVCGLMGLVMFLEHTLSTDASDL